MPVPIADAGAARGRERAARDAPAVGTHRAAGRAAGGRATAQRGGDAEAAVGGGAPPSAVRCDGCPARTPRLSGLGSPRRRGRATRGPTLREPESCDAVVCRASRGPEPDREPRRGAPPGPEPEPADEFAKVERRLPQLSIKDAAAGRRSARGRAGARRLAEPRQHVLHELVPSVPALRGALAEIFLDGAYEAMLCSKYLLPLRVRPPPSLESRDTHPGV